MEWAEKELGDTSGGLDKKKHLSKLGKLHHALTDKVFLVANRLSLADIVLAALVAPLFVRIFEVFCKSLLKMHRLAWMSALSLDYLPSSDGLISCSTILRLDKLSRRTPLSLISTPHSRQENELAKITIRILKPTTYHSLSLPRPKRRRKERRRANNQKGKRRPTSPKRKLTLPHQRLLRSNNPKRARHNPKSNNHSNPKRASNPLPRKVGLEKPFHLPPLSPPC